MGRIPAVHGNFKELGILSQINSGIDILSRAYPNLFLLGFEVRFKLVAYDFVVVCLCSSHTIEFYQSSSSVQEPGFPLCKSEIARGTF